MFLESHIFPSDTIRLSFLAISPTSSLLIFENTSLCNFLDASGFIIWLIVSDWVASAAVVIASLPGSFALHALWWRHICVFFQPKHSKRDNVQSCQSSGQDCFATQETIILFHVVVCVGCRCGYVLTLARPVSLLALSDFGEKYASFQYWFCDVFSHVVNS